LNFNQTLKTYKLLLLRPHPLSVELTAQCFCFCCFFFVAGSGCVLAETLQCMCTHLTDFQAGMNMGTGELKVPDVAVIDPGAMTSLSLADVAGELPYDAVSITQLSVLIATQLSFKCRFLDVAVIDPGAMTSLSLADVGGELPYDAVFITQFECPYCNPIEFQVAATL
jgi:hypothetical protein